jgi:hypothetical protein
MIQEPLAGPEETLNQLSSIHPEIYASFEYGIAKAKGYFEGEEIPVESSVFSALVRLHVKEYLQGKGVEDVAFYDLALCGLCFRYRQYLIRMWKARDDQLPPPGPSETRQSFYNQQYRLNFNGDSVELEPRHLAFLWNLDSRFNLSALWLVCPKCFDLESATTEAEWSIPVPHPVLTIRVKAIVSTPPDLPIERKDPQPKA